MSHYTTQIYNGYFRLGPTAYREKVRFFEENPDAISRLDFDDRIEMEFDYLYCLFEVGKYERFLSKVDAAIECIIIENIMEFNHDNIYNELLFRKSACYFQLKEYHKCENLLKQLIRMDRTNKLYIGLYTICKYKIESTLVTIMKAIAVVSFIVVLGITIARIFLAPFVEQYFGPFIILRLMMLGIGILSLVCLELYIQYEIYKETGMFSHTILNKIFGTPID